MINQLPKYTVLFFVLIFLQVMIFNNIQITSLGIFPFIYVIFIILLPFETPKWLLLISAFALGIIIDFFSDTYGLHASATVLMAFARPGILQFNAPRDGYEAGTQPRIFYYGFEWFLRYAVVLIFIHHLFFFYVEAFNFHDFFISLLKVILSTIFTGTFIVISQYLTFTK